MTADTIEITPQQGDTAFAYNDIVAIHPEAARYPGRFATVIGSVYNDAQAIALNVIGPKDGLEDDHVVNIGLLTKLIRRSVHPTSDGQAVVMPAIGQRVVVVEDEDRERSNFTGRVVNIGYLTGFPRYFPDGHIRSARDLGSVGTALFEWAEFPESMGGGLVEPEAQEGGAPDSGLADLQHMIARLSSERDTFSRELGAANRRLQQRNDEFEASMEIIGKRFWSEAKDRGWCSAADEIVAEINEELPVYKIPDRQQEFTSYVDVTGEMRVSVPVVISAASQEEADEQAANMSVSDIEENLSERNEDSIDALLTQRASRRDFDNLEVVEQ